MALGTASGEVALTMISSTLSVRSGGQAGQSLGQRLPGSGWVSSLAGGPPVSPPLMRYLTVVQGASRISSWSVPSRSAPFWLSTPMT